MTSVSGSQRNEQEQSNGKIVRPFSKERAKGQSQSLRKRGLEREHFVPASSMHLGVPQTGHVHIALYLTYLRSLHSELAMAFKSNRVDLRQFNQEIQWGPNNVLASPLSFHHPTVLISRYCYQSPDSPHLFLKKITGQSSSKLSSGSTPSHPGCTPSQLPAARGLEREAGKFSPIILAKARQRTPAPKGSQDLPAGWLIHWDLIPHRRAEREALGFWGETDVPHSA
ncbi:uncharacterized protein BDR25DRAFT_349278 [Lindgomyces ingoldianus]|uniref:Uncharacterized protein n=1 Tax=Lindgomyces ingoldianus TaxID=673940 RepID=A0ACB6RA61_9PLEO|nr:uncharacterized protein BDR25DRAFT_349278 [Lindgomyces ingoldianus]KAF2476159.1 hypothetical protein BDR25DRAFT_349278 [Lindgomyces ingoldianus]